MRAPRSTRPTPWLAAITLTIVAFAGASPVGAAPAEASTGEPVGANRWVRSVCRGVSTWLEARDEVDSRISETMGELVEGELTAKAAKKRLTRASAQGVEASEQLIDKVESAGTPKIDGGKKIAKDFLATLSDYRDAFERARAAFKGEKTRDGEQFTTAAEEIDATRIADLDEVGVDPVEELRGVADLASAIESSCGEVNPYLAAAIAPACKVALDTAEQLIEVDRQYYASEPGSAEETALLEEEFRLLGQLRVDLGACHVAGVPGPCGTALDTAQQLVQVHQRWLESTAESPEEQALLDEQERLFESLDSEVDCRS